ncbi:3-phosphoshikimate 1-carboxyvinyltransferase [Vallitalea pronyensis]|uniref:3-phosphoshikimate 1-carboxyvinyltransferase n=1 Tax=Vallitalea pronyensis TaxID=1348613 RepID=A0A8J8SGQ6_9FIRM|nr:3-phosphoshikimate 1-carboxyvinyltransferase [Vallitalea pronyensis]QUI22856.1 3-phosphoshikimate 1-carboxyvinyltransferase [Vallitalea pronyensis]
MIIKPRKSLSGTMKVPGDKSISHRAIMLGALAEGTTTIKGFLMGEDCLSTITCFQKMGVHIDIEDAIVTVEGKGLRGLKKPTSELDVGNSGTTLRLLSGILAAQDFECTITGDDSIKTRPMKRIIEPLLKMGAHITSINDNDRAPLYIKGSTLQNITYHSPVASAQVKSCIMLASLFTEGQSTIIEPVRSRNHSEIMLNVFGGHIEADGCAITTSPVDQLSATDIIVPGDISSAAYFMVAGLILEDADITIEQVGINPTRDGIIHVLQAMNGNITVFNKRIMNGELVADIRVQSSQLKGTIIDKPLIPTLIDEIPVIAVAACFAEGTTLIKDASELRVKESDRIATMVSELTKMHADIQGTEDGMIIHHSPHLIGNDVESYHDHRVAMSLAVAGLAAKGITTIHHSDCVDISFPHFFKLINGIS